MTTSISQYFREHDDVRMNAVGVLLTDDILEMVINTHVEYIIDSLPEEPDVRDKLLGRKGFLTKAQRERLPLLAMVETALSAAQNYPVICQLQGTNPDALDSLLKVGLMLNELGTYDNLKN